MLSQYHACLRRLREFVRDSHLFYGLYIHELLIVVLAAEQQSFFM
jgi:hypothetical protein